MKKRLFFLCCFTLHTYTMNKSLMTLEQSPLSKEIIQSYLLQLQKEPPSHHNNNFENIVKALIGKSQPKQAIAELNGYELNGQTLRVNEARAPEARGPRPGGDRFGGDRGGSRGGQGGGWGSPRPKRF
jgi:hypothetical protein